MEEDMLVPRFFHRALLLSLSLVLSVLSPKYARAVVDAHSQTNTVPPIDGVPWDHVGSHNGSTGVYLGERWVLSAGHVGAGNIFLVGTNYSYDGVSFNLTNTDKSAADLVLFHLTSTPPLTNLVLASSVPALNTPIDMIGCGRIAGAATNIGGSAGFAWGPYTGLKTWGNNKANGATSLVGTNPITTCFTSTFSSSSQSSHEAQLAAQDSGGGTFALSGSAWQLAGINLYVSRSDAAIFGDTSYFGNIATYRNQILWRMTTGARPYLSIQKNGGSVQVSWPLAATGYRLQAASSLTGTWTALTAALTTSGTTNLAATNTMRFFRLVKP